MSKSKNHDYDKDESHFPSFKKFLGIMIVLGVIPLLITYLLMSFQEREEQAITAIKAEQVTEGKQYTAVVTAVDMSNGTVTLDNGDVIPADALEMTPNTNDVLSYTKTFGYEISDWDGTPKRTDQDAFFNVESIGNTSK